MAMENVSKTEPAAADRVLLADPPMENVSKTEPAVADRVLLADPPSAITIEI